MYIRNLILPQLSIDTLEICDGQSWCFFGDNRSGINTFLQLLGGEITTPPEASITLPKAPAVISFALQQQIYEEELRKDDTNFINRLDPGTPAAKFIPSEFHSHPLIDILDFRKVMDCGYRQLSSGQNRKLLLLQALFGGASPVVLDCPFDGLDRASCHELDTALRQLAANGILLLILVRNQEDIPAWCSHLGIFHKGQLVHQGELHLSQEQLGHFSAPDDHSLQLKELKTCDESSQTGSQELIRLSDGFAGYGDKSLFKGLNLSIQSGDHTLITGPNGCGKSTLLHVLTGDHPLCYANDLYLFGRKRGSGESIWDVKKNMGIVSPEIHRSYRVACSALHVVLSGLFDTIGLYRQPSDSEIRAGRQWLAMLNMSEMAGTPFRRLAYGDQRLILIARALIKSPPLLILDEPTQGLDKGARLALLDFLEQQATGLRSTILFVSHRQDEYRPFFHQHIQLERYSCQ